MARFFCRYNSFTFESLVVENHLKITASMIFFSLSFPFRDHIYNEDFRWYEIQSLDHYYLPRYLSTPPPLIIPIKYQATRLLHTWWGKHLTLIGKGSKSSMTKQGRQKFANLNPKQSSQYSERALVQEISERKHPHKPLPQTDWFLQYCASQLKC